MKKSIIFILTILTAFSFTLSLTGCKKKKDLSQPMAIEVLNGGFESGDLSGWTVEYGDAFNDDSVSSQKTFVFDYDDKRNEIPVNATGNWYLSGKGFDGTFRNSRKGAIRSTNFLLTDDGMIYVKLAGGAITNGKGEGASYKPDEKVCYLGVYTANDDKLVCRQTNEYFLEHTESYVNVGSYLSGSCNTDNFYEYVIDASDYIGQEMYIRIVDNDDSVYYGYISVDDIRIGSSADSQPDGAFYTKTRNYIQNATAPSEYEIANGDFELGSLAGWTIVSGDAFSHNGVNREDCWWNENITYSRDGNYHYGHYNPSATGVMRSTEFKLGGSGYISYKLGGCSDMGKTYLRFMMKTESGDKEIARLSNFKYWNYQFPYVQNGMKLLNLVQYYVDFSMYLGQTMYIEVVDENASNEDLGCITLDSIQTYHEEKPVWYTSNSYEAKINSDIEIESEYQVYNGTFETGDLTGWTMDGQQFIEISANQGWWQQNFSYNKKGNYLLTGINLEGNTGTLTSSSFKVGGSGYISFLMGGAGNPKQCYISIIDAETETEYLRFGNSMFHDIGVDNGLVNRGSNLANMVQYVADLTSLMDKEVKIRIVDNATRTWGLITADSFITYYADKSALPKGFEARNILPKEVLGANNIYQVYNGDFETGDLTGWTLDGNILGIGHDEVWWNEWFSFNKDGEYFLNGWKGEEVLTGTLTSSSFTIGGIGYITYKLGGAKNLDVCQVQIIDAETEEVLAAYGNQMFKDTTKRYFYNGKPIDLSKDGVYKANMVQYTVDLSEFMGREVKIRLVDNATNDWGLFFADSFITYYENMEALPTSSVTATKI